MSTVHNTTCITSGFHEEPERGPVPACKIPEHIDIVKAINESDLDSVQKWINHRQHHLHQDLDCAIGQQQQTPLHIAAKHNSVEITRKLLEAGADPKAKDEKGDTALHIACQAKPNINPNLVDILLNPPPVVGGRDEPDSGVGVDYIDAQDNEQKTALHYATQKKDEKVVEKLLAKKAEVDILDDGDNSPIHLAASAGSVTIIAILLRYHLECVDIKGYKGRTPLHLAGQNNHATAAVRVLLEHGASLTAKDNNGHAALSLACKYGSVEMVQFLLKRGAEDKRSLECAISRGHKNIVMTLVQSDQWRSTLRHKYNRNQNQDGSRERQETTPFRELIRTMPDIAEEVLNKCTVYDPNFPNPGDENYTVYFDYEFVNDFTLHGNRYRQPQSESHFQELVNRSKSAYDNGWGPAKYEMSQHPLSIMARKHPKLLTHPLVRSLLHRKWNEFGWLFYLDFFLYALFMVSLTTFALLVPNPQMEQCVALANELVVNRTSNLGVQPEDESHSYCDTSTVVQIATYAFAGSTMLFAFIRIAWEVFELCVLKLHYLKSWINYMEWLLYSFSVLFTCFTFVRECQCPYHWQWEIGTAAVFLSWLNLIAFISETPLNGLYLLMFTKIVWTFIQATFLPVLFVIAFALTFYMCFHEPGITRSPFSHPARSMLRTMTMTVGDIDTDGIFRQDISGASDSRYEVPFPAISYIIWITFIILMPVLITNLLIGLAVDDIGDISKKAEETKLAFQVQQVLTVEQLLPRKSRKWRTSGKKKLSPNKRDGRFKKTMKHISFFLWGGEYYGNYISLNQALHYEPDSLEKVHQKADHILDRLEKLEETMSEVKLLLKNKLVQETEV